MHEGMLGNGDVEQSSGESRIASRGAGISCHLHDDHGIGAERLIKSWISRKLAWRLDDFTLAAICYADDLVLIAVSIDAAESMVYEVIEKLKEIGLTVGAQKTHWTSFPKMMDKHITVDGSAVVWECTTCDRTQNSSSQQMSCKMENCVEIPMAPQIVAGEHRKDYDVAGFPLELECLDDDQGTERKNCELERENGGECYWSEKAARNGAGTVVETLAQDWSSMDREMQYERTGCRDRMLSWAGHVARLDYKEICAKALRCRGLQWWRWGQLFWKEVERDKLSGPHPQRFNIYRWEDMVAGEVSKFVGNADGLSKTVQDNTGWLHFAQNRGSWKQFSKCGKSPV